MDDQHKTQARNCIANYCSYPRTTANELVAKMTDEELQSVLDVGNQIQLPDAEKQKAIGEILDQFTKRLEGAARAEAQGVMKEQKHLHATKGQFGTPAEDDQVSTDPPASETPAVPGTGEPSADSKTIDPPAETSDPDPEPPAAAPTTPEVATPAEASPQPAPQPAADVPPQQEKPPA